MEGVLNSKVLVLNRSYMAVRVTTARRAFHLLVKNLAEVIAVEDGHYANYDFPTWTELGSLQRQYEPDAHEWVQTVRFCIAVPKVIRLLGYDRLPKQQVKLNRRNIFARDRNRCQYCGKVFPSSELSLDHVVPRSQGGRETWTNLVCACTRCNARKGGRTPQQAAIALIREPYKPRRNPALTLRLGSPRYACWQAFLNDAYWSVELR
ncbi:MAG: HNH endonuclease [Planctomycetes bacterium]|nr:HNH endonuclease [Planctomycetota bacterium]NOG53858.1 HNH endonuclease [Planctomycetota bacterium]